MPTSHSPNPAERWLSSGNDNVAPFVSAALAGAALAAEAPARCSAALDGLVVATMAKVEAMILCVIR